MGSAPTPPRDGHSECFTSRKIYADIRRNRPPRTERERVEARELRRRQREERERRARQGIRSIEYLRMEESSESDGEGWGIRATASGTPAERADWEKRGGGVSLKRPIYNLRFSKNKWPGKKVVYDKGQP